MQKQKKLGARILSLVLTAAMVGTMMPVTVFATENSTPLGASNVECHVTHDKDCGYKEAVEGAECSHKNEDGTYSCAPVSDNTAIPGDADKPVCTHEDDCGYTEAIEGADCKHTCAECTRLPVQGAMTRAGGRLPLTITIPKITIQQMDPIPVITFDDLTFEGLKAGDDGPTLLRAANARFIGVPKNSLHTSNGNLQLQFSENMLPDYDITVVNGSFSIDSKIFASHPFSISPEASYIDGSGRPWYAGPITLTATDPVFPYIYFTGSKDKITNKIVLTKEVSQTGRGEPFRVSIDDIGTNCWVNYNWPSLNQFDYKMDLTPPNISLTDNLTSTTTSVPIRVFVNDNNASGGIGSDVKAVYYTCVPADVATPIVPTAEAIIANNIVGTEDNNGIYNATINGLKPNTGYIAYTVAVDNVGNISKVKATTRFSTQAETLAGSIELSTTTPKVGDTITVTAKLTNQEPGALTYTWYYVGGWNPRHIGESYTVLPEDLGKGLGVVVSSEQCQGDLRASTAGVVKADQAALTFSPYATKKTYGDPNFTLTATGGTGTGNITYMSSDDQVATVTDSGEVTIVKPGDFTITATKEGNESYEKASVVSDTITVAQKEVTVTAVVDEKEYDGRTTAYVTYTVNGVIGTEDVRADGTAAFENANAGIDKTVNITGIKLKGLNSANYQLSSASATAKGTIYKSSINATIDSIRAVDFTGSQIKPSLTVRIDDGMWIEATDYTVEYGTNMDAGTGSVTVKEATGGNYAFKDVTANFTINKTAYTGTAVTGTKVMMQNTSQTGVTFDLKTLTFPAGFKDKTFGAVSYSANTDGVLTGIPSIRGTKITFDVDSVVKDKSGVIDIVVSSKNYTDYIAKITVTTVEKLPVIINGTAATGLVYNGSAQKGYTAVSVEGKKVPVSELDFIYRGTDKNGTAYGPTTIAPTKAGDYKLVVSVKVSNTTYSGASSDIIFGIDQKGLVVMAKDQCTYQYKELPVTELVYNGFVNGEDATVLGTSAYTAAHAATDTETAGEFAIDVSGSTPNKNYSITTTNGKLTIQAVSPPELTNSEPPTLPITKPQIVAEPKDSTKRLRMFFSSELVAGEKENAMAQIPVTAGAVTITQEVELQVSDDDGATWTKATAADVKGGKMQVMWPIPPGTSPSRYTYMVYHFVNGATAAPKAIEPIVSVSTNSLSATVNSLSPFVIVATPRAGDDSSSETYYYIKATAGPGGSMNSPERVKVRAGKSAGFTINPDKGYQIEDVLVNGKSVGAKNYYVFTDVYSDQTIHATFKKAEHNNPQTGVSIAEVATIPVRFEELFIK
ncbi:MAG: YDG domain-containing protein [Lachnospiraceae bacterium]